MCNIIDLAQPPTQSANKPRSPTSQEGDFCSGTIVGLLKSSQSMEELITNLFQYLYNNEAKPVVPEVMEDAQQLLLSSTLQFV